MKKQFGLIGMTTAIALLAACSGGDEATGGEEADGASGSASATLEPGKYEMTVKVLNMQMPEIQGMPAGAEDMFKKQMENTTSYCLTPEQAKEAAFERTSQQAKEQMGGDCEIEKDNNSASRLDMTIVCTPQGGKMRMDMQGKLTGSGVRVVMDADGEVAGQRMAFKTEYTSRRVGECDGSEPTAG